MAELGPVARTAYYCCLLRAADAARPDPLCGDRHAERFLDAAIRRELAPLLRFRGPSESNVARHRLVDDLLRQAIAACPERRIFVVGAGFDTRAFRLPGAAGGSSTILRCSLSRKRNFRRRRPPTR